MKTKKKAFNKYLKTIYSLFPFYMILGCFIMRFYLNELGRLSLFSSLIESNTAFIAIMISFILLSISLLFLFSLPSILLFSTIFMIKQDTIRRVINKNRIPGISFLASSLAIIIIYIVALNENTPDWLSKNLVGIVALLLLPIIFIIVHFMSITRKKPCIYYNNGKKYESKFFFKEKAILSLIIFSSSFASFFPLLFVLNVSSAQNQNGITALFIISFLLLIIAFLPAVFLFMSSSTAITYNIITYPFIPSMCIFVIAMFLIPNFASIVSYGSLKNIGVIERDLHIYAIKKDNYTPDMFPSKIWNHINESNTKNYFIKGGILFSLGGKTLLCPTYVIDARTKYMKYNLDNLFSPMDELHSRYLKEITKSCAIVSSEDIRQWDGIIDGRNIGSNSHSEDI